MAAKQRFRSDIAWSTETNITVHGLDLCSEILGKVSLSDMAYLQIMGRLPTPPESRMFEALSLTLVEHGLTPSAIVARMTLAGAPEAMQGAVAAGLNGLGSVFVGSMETAAKILQDAMLNQHEDTNVETMAKTIVQERLATKQSIPGIGHHMHKPIDPRTVRLFEIATELGFNGRYVSLMVAIGNQASEQLSKSLPVNATGAIAAIASELQIPWHIVRGIGVFSRAIGLVGHIVEETRNPMARQMKKMIETEALAHFQTDQP